MADYSERSPAPGPAPDGEGGVAAEALTYLGSLYATALRLTRDPAAADDLVQDTYLKVVRFGARFEPGTNLRAWLFTILHNTFRNERRGAGRDPVAVDSEVVESAADVRPGRESPEDLLLRDVLDTDLKAALDSLPEAYRQCVWLRDVEEFSYGEIAGMLDVPIGTVMSRISRGRRLMHQYLTTTAAGEGRGRPADSAGRKAPARRTDGHG